MKNIGRYIGIGGMLLLCCCAGVHQNKLPEQTPRKNYSFKGKAKLKIIGQQKTISCTMMYCCNADKNEFISEFTGPMFKNLGYFSVNEKEIFFYIRESQSHVKTNADASFFSRITGLDIEPLSFIKLFQGHFDPANLALHSKEATEQFLINYYDSAQNVQVAERVDKSSKMLNSLLLYKNKELYASIELKYKANPDILSSLEISLKSANIKMVLEIGKQDSIEASECRAPDLSILEKSSPIDINQYDSQYPLILDLVP